MFFRPLTDAGPPGLPGDPGDPGEPGEPEVPILPMALMAPMAQAESLGNVETAVAKPMPPAGPPRDMGPPTPATPMPFAAPMAPVAPFAVALESPWATAYAAGDPPESLADPDAPLTVFDFALYPAWEPLDNEVAGEMKLSSTLLCMALDSDLSNVVAAVFGAQFRPQGARVKPYVALNSLELTNAVMELPAVLIGADENGGSGEDLNLDAESLLQVANEMAPQKQKAVRANLPGVEVHPDPRAGQEAVSPDVEMLINSPSSRLKRPPSTRPQSAAALGVLPRLQLCKRLLQASPISLRILQSSFTGVARRTRATCSITQRILTRTATRLAFRGIESSVLTHTWKL